MIGSKIGAYRVDSKLGEGGMGVVYRATDTELDRTVAIKTLISIGDEESEARFLREARVASRLQHPSIVTIHHFGVSEDHSRYIVMEFVEGKTLKRVINGKPMAVTQICEMALQIADALSIAHDNGVVHRDLKAENVMVTPRGQVKILDFGLAKLKEPETSTGNEETAVFKTQEGLVVGTVSHMSPEQAMGADVDARSDIFSLGVVLYEMTTGEMPFAAPSAQATMAQVLNHNPAPVSALNPDIPPELDSLVTQCLQKDRMLRPSASEVVYRLKNVLASLSARSLSAPEIRGLSGIAPVIPGSSSVQLPIPSSTGAATALPSSHSRIAAPSGQTIAVTMPASGPAQAAPPPPIPAAARQTYYALRTLRIAISIITLTVPLAFFLYFVVSGGLIRPQVIEGTALMSFMRRIVTPALRISDTLFNFRTVYEGWNFILVGFGIVAFLVRQVVILPFQKLEHRAKTGLVQAKVAAPVALTVHPSERRQGDRLAMLREYAEAKKMLFHEKRHIAFLAIDLMNASQMKAAEDKLVVEHAFSEYRKFVERSLSENKVWKFSWTAEGLIAAFNAPDEAVAAAQQVLNNLNWFNDGIHQLRVPFRVHCGVNCDEVVFPENKRVEDISDETIDVARELQASAAEDALWMTRETLAMLRDQRGFRPMTLKQVHGHAVIEWRVSDTRAAAAGQ